MSEDENQGPELEELATACAEAMSAILAEQATATLSIEAGDADEIAPASLWDGDGPFASAFLHFKGESFEALHLWLSEAGAHALVALAGGADAASLASRQDEAAPGAASLDECTALVERLATAAAQAIGEPLGIAPGAFGDLVLIASEAELGERLGSADCPHFVIDVAVEDSDDIAIDVLLSSAAPRGGAGYRGVVVIEPDGESLRQAQSLENELGRPIVGQAPAEVRTDALDAYANADAIVVAWDLGTFCGLELAEQIRHVRSLDDVPLALSHEEPTAAMVRAALRASADTFLHKPYDAAELRERLHLAEGASDDASGRPAEQDSDDS